MERADLLRRAKNDFWNVELIMKQELSDIFQLDLVAYHIQQTVEKLMKFEMEQSGIDFEWTHEIDVLYKQMEDANLNPPKWILESSKILTDYATKTRYHENLIAGRKRLEEYIPLVRDFLLYQQQQEQKRQEQHDFPISENFN